MKIKRIAALVAVVGFGVSACGSSSTTKTTEAAPAGDATTAPAAAPEVTEAAPEATEAAPAATEPAPAETDAATVTQGGDIEIAVITHSDGGVFWSVFEKGAADAGKALGVRACDLIGGALRESIPFASYLFYRYGNAENGFGAEFSAEAVVKEAKRQKQLHGFKTHKLKGGVFAPEHDVEVFSALAEAFPGDRFRLDPNSVWSVEESIWVASQIQHIRNDYFEDPCFGLEGMRRLRDRISIPTATNTVVVNFEQLASCIKHDAVDVILLDTTFWGGLRQAYKAGQVLETFQYGASVHSSGELGIQLASMLHLGAALPNMSFAADAHYHHLVDDIIVGGKLQYVDGEIAVPTGPGLGVEVDRERLAHYAAYFREVGGYTYDRDPQRPDWYSIQPEMRYADPARH